MNKKERQRTLEIEEFRVRLKQKMDGTIEEILHDMMYSNGHNNFSTMIDKLFIELRMAAIGKYDEITKNMTDKLAMTSDTLNRINEYICLNIAKPKYIEAASEIALLIASWLSLFTNDASNKDLFIAPDCDNGKRIRNMMKIAKNIGTIVTGRDTLDTQVLVACELIKMAKSILRSSAPELNIAPHISGKLYDK